MTASARFVATTFLAAALFVPSVAFAAGGVRFSYEKVDLEGATEWVLVPVAVNGLGGKPNATKLKTAFELLKKQKRASYGSSTITVSGAPPRAKVIVKIDPKVSRYALIVMAETVYTLTELGAASVAFPGHADGALTREDIPFAAYSLTVPLWKAVGRFDSDFVNVLMPDGSLEPSPSIAKKWKSNDSGLRASVYKYLDASDNYTVQTVAKLLPELKVPYKDQVSKLLGHKSDSVRLTALGVLEKDRNDKDVLDAVSKMLDKEKDAKVARAAADFLGKSSNSTFAAEQQFYLLENGSAAEQAAAAKALGKTKDKRAASKLAAKLTDKDAKVASAAAESLGSLNAHDEQKAALKNSKVSGAVKLAIAADLAAAKDNSAEIAGRSYIVENGADHEGIGALQALGKMRGDDARKAIESFLTDKKEVIRLAALEVLEGIGAADSVPAIAGAMKKGLNEDKMEAAGYAIMAKQSVDAILAKTKDGNSLVQRMAYVAISEKKNPGSKAFSALESGTKSSDALVRGAAARAVGSYANKDAERILKSMVGDRSGAVRADVAHGIGFLKEGVLYEELKALLDDKDAEVQAAAALSLGKRGEAGPWDKIKALTNSSSPAARAGALTSLAALVSRDDAQGVNEVVSKLSGAVTDKSLKVREAAIVALGTFGIDKAVTAISLQAGAEEPRIRVLAIEALANTKNPSAVAVIEDRLLDQNYTVRQAAILALGRMKAKAQLQKHLKNEKNAELKSLTQSTLKKL